MIASDCVTISLVFNLLLRKLDDISNRSEYLLLAWKKLSLPETNRFPYQNL
jgi:hypothetical protein